MGEASDLNLGDSDQWQEARELAEAILGVDHVGYDPEHEPPVPRDGLDGFDVWGERLAWLVLHGTSPAVAGTADRRLTRDEFERVCEEVYAEDKAAGWDGGRNGNEQRAAILERIAQHLGVESP